MGWDQGLPGGSAAIASLRCACVRVEGEFMRSGRAICHITETVQSTFRYVEHSLLRPESERFRDSSKTELFKKKPRAIQKKRV